MGSAGSVYLIGNTRGNWSGVNKGARDFAVVKLHANGSELWRWQVNGPRRLELCCSRRDRLLSELGGKKRAIVGYLILHNEDVWWCSARQNCHLMRTDPWQKYNKEITRRYFFYVSQTVRIGRGRKPPQVVVGVRATCLNCLGETDQLLYLTAFSLRSNSS